MRKGSYVAMVVNAADGKNRVTVEKVASARGGMINLEGYDSVFPADDPSTEVGREQWLLYPLRSSNWLSVGPASLGVMLHAWGGTRQNTARLKPATRRRIESGVNRMLARVDKLHEKPIADRLVRFRDPHPGVGGALVPLPAPILDYIRWVAEGSVPMRLARVAARIRHLAGAKARVQESHNSLHLTIGDMAGDEPVHAWRLLRFRTVGPVPKPKRATGGRR